MEEENFDQLPGEVYALGFIRTYAAHLGLNAPDMVSRFKANRQPVVLDEGAAASEGESEPISTALKIGLPVAGVIVFFIMWLLADSSDEPTETATPPVIARQTADPPTPPTPTEIETAPQTTTPPTAAPIVRAPVPQTEGVAQKIEIRAVRRTWMRLENAEGRILFSSIINPGKGVELKEDGQYTLATRDAGALEFSVDGVGVGTIGRRGQILTQRKFSRNDILDNL